MPSKTCLDLSGLDRCIGDLADLRSLIGGLQKIEKCCTGVAKGHNLADILSDAANRDAILSSLECADLGVAVQILTKVALADYSTRSVTLRKDISGRKKLDFCYRTLGAWNQFDAVLAVQWPDSEQLPLLLNPKRAAQWKALDTLPAEALCSLYLRGTDQRRQRVQEHLALDRFEALLAMLEEQEEPVQLTPAPVVELRSKTGRTEKAEQARSKPRTTTAPRIWGSSGAALGNPVASLKIVINKIDTFLHAGNAQLIANHMTSYAGRVRFYVLRDVKKAVSIDTDSIWSAEIRNGESVLFEFFGPKPTSEFLKELAKKVNKYCQMDKVMDG